MVISICVLPTLKIKKLNYAVAEKTQSTKLNLNKNFNYNMLIRQVTSRADGDRFGKDFGGATHRPSGPHFFPPPPKGLIF